MLCADCRRVVIDSNSERGYKYCPNCSTTKSRGDVLEILPKRRRRCPCCQENHSYDGEVCGDCRDAGCDPVTTPCSYRRQETEPADCDHDFFDRAPLPGIECRWCGYVTAGGPSGNDYGELWVDRRREALERDNYRCRGCGIGQEEHREKHDEGLQVHHIVPYRSFEEDIEAHRLDNLVSLCVDCHGKFESMDSDEQKSRLFP